MTAPNQARPSVTVPDPVELLRVLLRFDTTNPPGRERACLEWVADLLREAGVEPELLALDPERPNLIARLPGRGEAAPLLLYGHVDVVPTAGQRWSVPPFEGALQGGWVWGRGALDMKGGVAMLLTAFLRAAQARALAGDLILALFSDEEAGGNVGARWLAGAHPERFAGVRHALGEWGGFALHLGGKTFYPIQVAEKQLCTLRLTFRGPGGHGSLPLRGGAMARLGRALGQLDAPLPVHVTPPVAGMIRGMADALDGAAREGLLALLDPATADAALSALGSAARLFDPLLRHTASPTVVRGGEKTNVIPSEVTLELDGRLLPGARPTDLIGELRARLGEEVELEVLRFDEGPPEADMTLFETLAGVLRGAHPGAVPVPLVLTGVSDARHLAPLGIQTYGFIPMNLPADFDFLSVVHAADERVPAESVVFGADAVYAAVRRILGVEA